jgi:hypothetical protein
VLKEQLVRAQERMKRFADKRRYERKFHNGEWAYLKLQSYRQVSIQGNSKHRKLKPKYYVPYEIIERIGVSSLQIEFAQWIFAASYFLCVTTEKI